MTKTITTVSSEGLPLRDFLVDVVSISNSSTALNRRAANHPIVQYLRDRYEAVALEEALLVAIEKKEFDLTHLSWCYLLFFSLVAKKSLASWNPKLILTLSKSEFPLIKSLLIEVATFDQKSSIIANSFEQLDMKKNLIDDKQPVATANSLIHFSFSK